MLNFNPSKFTLKEQLAVLKGHSGLVKGVTWDPVGKYLASQVSYVL
jgi:protein HIRA/HIR1